MPPLASARSDVIAATSWLEMVTVKPVEPLLSAELGRGEAEVIALATARSGAAVLIDERRGRRIAETVYGLTVRGTVGTLVVAKRRQLIAEPFPHLDALTRSGYHLAPSLIDAACRAVGER